MTTRTNNLAQKMVNIMSRVDSVFKGGRVRITDSASYTAVLHDDVAALLHKELVQENVWVKVSILDATVTTHIKKKSGYNGSSPTESLEYMATVKCRVTFINADNPQDREDVDTFSYALDSGDKAVGKAESMAVKYAFLKNFTLESTDDEEARNGFDENNPPQQKERQPSNAQTPLSEPQKKVLYAIKSKHGVNIPDFKTSSEASLWINNFNKTKGKQ